MYILYVLQCKMKFFYSNCSVVGNYYSCKTINCKMIYDSFFTFYLISAKRTTPLLEYIKNKKLEKQVGI